MNNFTIDLPAFIETFIGYGADASTTWFVGPEEAGAKSVDDLMRRVSVWRELGEEPVVDLYDFHRLLGVTEHFTENARPQFTWRRLIEIALVLDGQTPDSKAIREYQRHQLGRRDGTTLLTELMPLPKPTIGSWFYDGLSDTLPYLSDLQSYHRAVRPKRIALLRAAIERYQPQRVFFYGTSGGLLDAWQEVAGVGLTAVEDGYWRGRLGRTTYVVLKHPNARGMPREYFLQAAAVAK
ncbi:hypothetical protein [Aeoliella sp. SH292]|uniref:hypothetical protein n=1 Tax=Aeoliella sp. SH292 TaxID=3454464 RepID=UPI003F998192